MAVITALIRFWWCGRVQPWSLCCLSPVGWWATQGAHRWLGRRVLEPWWKEKQEGWQRPSKQYILSTTHLSPASGLISISQWPQYIPAPQCRARQPGEQWGIWVRRFLLTFLSNRLVARTMSFISVVVQFPFSSLAIDSSQFPARSLPHSPPLALVSLPFRWHGAITAAIGSPEQFSRREETSKRGGRVSEWEQTYPTTSLENPGHS